MLTNWSWFASRVGVSIVALAVTQSAVCLTSVAQEVPIIAAAAVEDVSGSDLINETLPQLSTIDSTTVLNADGSYTRSVSSVPINYQNESGFWVPISNQLVQAPSRIYSFENEANSYDLSIPENPATTPVRFETDGSWVDMKLAGSRDVDASVEGSEATFNSLVPSVDEVRYAATDSGVKETITLDGPPTTAVVFRYVLNVSPEITPVLTQQNTVEFRDAEGKPKFVMPAPNMEDSAKPNSGYSNAIVYGLSRRESSWSLSVTPDHNWLTDPTRVYPVRVDPSVDKADGKDCWVQNDQPNANRCQNDYVYSGLAAGGVRRGLLDFGVNSLPSNSTVNSASLNLFLDSNMTAGNAGNQLYSVYKPSARWNGSVTWNTSGTGVNWGGGRSGSPISNSLSIGGGTTGWFSWDVTGTVSSWAGGGDNVGFMIAENSESANKQLGFISGTNAFTQWRPVLRIDYSVPTSAAPTTAPSGVTVSPCVAPCYSDWLLANNLTPTITAAANPDGVTETYTFQIADFSTDAVVSSGSVTVGPGGTAAWPVPSGAITADNVYEIRAIANGPGGSAASGWTPMQSRNPLPPDAATALKASPCGSCAAGEATTTTPELSAVASDPGYDNLTTQFQIRTTGGAVIQSGAGSRVVEGGRSVYTVPQGVLSNNGTYQFRVITTDPDGLQSTSDWRDFSVKVNNGPLPTNVAANPCQQNSCTGGASLTSTTPTLSATNSSTGSAEVRFEITAGTGVVTGAVPNVASGAIASWTVPAGAVPNGAGSLRVGLTTGTGTNWTKSYPINIEAEPNSQPSFAANESVGGTSSSDPNEISEASRPYAPNSAVNNDDAGAAAASTKAQRAQWTGAYVATGEEASATTDTLAKNFAPVLLFDSEEKYYPLSARTFLNNSKLDWWRSCSGELMSNNPVWSYLGSGSYSHLSSEVVCGSPINQAPRWYSNSKDVRPYNAGGPLGRSGMYLDLDNQYRDGGGPGDANFRGDEPTYYSYARHKYLAYSFLYGDSAIANPIEEKIRHEGDWEFYWVILNSADQPKAAIYEIHGKSCVLPFSAAPKFTLNSTHAVIAVGNHSHANYPAGKTPRLDDDASGDGSAWYTARNMRALQDEAWWGYTGAWGSVGAFEVTSGPEGPDPYKGAPLSPTDYC